MDTAGVPVRSSFVDVHKALRNEKLYVASEKIHIPEAYQSLNKATHTLMSVCWLWKKRQRDMHKHLTKSIDMMEWEKRFREIRQIDDIQISDGSELGQNLASFEEYLTALYHSPEVVARGIIELATRLGDNYTRLADVCRIVLFDLFGGFWPTDEDMIEAVLTHLLRAHVASWPGSPAETFSGISPFSLLFDVYATESVAGCAFARLALHDTVMAVLADDDLDLEIEPTILWSRLPDAEQVRMLGPNHGSLPLNTDILVACPPFKVLLDEVYDRLFVFCGRFVDALVKTAFAIPPILRSLCISIVALLKDRGYDSHAIKVALCEVLLSRFFCEAITLPEVYGVVVDIPITNTARRNLELLATTLRAMGLGSYESSDYPFMVPLYERLQRLGQVELDSFFSKIFEYTKTDAAGSSGSHGRMHAIVSSVDNILTLQELVVQKELPEGHKVRLAHKKLPQGLRDNAAPGWEAKVLRMCIRDSKGAKLLTEADVLAHGTLPTSPSMNAAKKLRLAMIEISDGPHLTGNMKLVELLQTAHVRALIEGNTTAASILTETLRLVSKLPLPEADLDGVLHDELVRQLQERECYVTYLAHAHLSIMAAEEEVNRATALLRGSVLICEKYFWSCVVRRFLTQMRDQVLQFGLRLKEIEPADDRAAFVSGFVETMRNEFLNTQLLLESPPEESDVAGDMLERTMHCAVYFQTSFMHECDAGNDKLFYEHISVDLQYITTDHAAVQISNKYLAEAPWPAAQQCLRQLRAHKNPRDKMHCIVDLSGVATGADDFFPILVFVILKANPPNLLSSIQYIRYFGAALTNSGEESYWWTQFVSAVTFIQSIDDRCDALSPLQHKAPATPAKSPKALELATEESSEEEGDSEA